MSLKKGLKSLHLSFCFAQSNMDGTNFSKCLLSVSRVLKFGISFPPFFFFHYVKSSYLCIAYSLSKYRSKISLCLMRLKSKQSLNTLNECMRFLLLSLGLAIQLLWKFSKGLWESIPQSDQSIKVCFICIFYCYVLWQSHWGGTTCSHLNLPTVSSLQNCIRLRVLSSLLPWFWIVKLKFTSEAPL